VLNVKKSTIDVESDRLVAPRPRPRIISRLASGTATYSGDDVLSKQQMVPVPDSRVDIRRPFMQLRAPLQALDDFAHLRPARFATGRSNCWSIRNFVLPACDLFCNQCMSVLAARFDIRTVDF